ncbi:MAG: DUF3108 domain-containing protein [Verrucomicrobia bacterium]|nr:DUF3108 domain-containing protein [Verrucomicrobiota bacterium]
MSPIRSLLFCLLLPFTAPTQADLPASSPPPETIVQLERTSSAAPDYLAHVDSPARPGEFPPPRPFQAIYRMRWGEVDAARAEVTLTRPSAEEIQLRVVAATLGMARSLWQMDATHIALAKEEDLRPLQLEQHETLSARQTALRVVFNPSFVLRRQLNGRPGDWLKFSPDSAAETPHETKRFDLVGLRDMFTTFLYLRSQPLAGGESHTIALMSAKNPYLATAKVVGRETIHVRGGRFAAITLDLTLTRIEKNGKLREHKAFKSARAWIADDADRMLLKVDTRVFIGRVTMELDNVTFNNP